MSFLFDKAKFVSCGYRSKDTLLKITDMVESLTLAWCYNDYNLI